MKSLEKGITLIEIIVVVFLIAVFSMILITDFPKIQRLAALSRAAYNLAQDFRKTQDLGLSGVKIKDNLGNPVAIKGYGLYVEYPSEQYIIYADVNGNQKYDVGQDYIYQTIDVAKESSSTRISNISNIEGYFTSINFSPPNPIINIDNISSGNSEIGITLGLTTDSATRTVWVNKSGLVSVR